MPDDAQSQIERVDNFIRLANEAMADAERAGSIEEKRLYMKLAEEWLIQATKAALTLN